MGNDDQNVILNYLDGLTEMQLMDNSFPGEFQITFELQEHVNISEITELIQWFQGEGKVLFFLVSYFLRGFSFE